MRVLVSPAKRRALSRHPPGDPCLLAVVALEEPLSGYVEPTQEKHSPAVSGGSARIQSCLLFMFGMPGLLIIYLNDMSNGCWVTKIYK